MEDLPALVLERVASYLGDADVLSLGATCTRAREACREEAVWQPRCEVYGVRLPCAAPASSVAARRQGEGPEVEKPPAQENPSSAPAAQQPMQQPMDADTETADGGKAEQPAEAAAHAAGGPANSPPGLTYRTLYLGLLRHYGVLLTGQQPCTDHGPAVQDAVSAPPTTAALWQATAMPWGGIIVAQYEPPAQIVLYSVIAYRLNGPVRGRPVLRIAARHPPAPRPRVSSTSPSRASPDAPALAPEGATSDVASGTEGASASELASPAAAAAAVAVASAASEQGPSTSGAAGASGAGGAGATQLWKRLVGMMQDMLSTGGGGGGGDGSGHGGSGAPAVGASPVPAVPPTSSGDVNSPDPPIGGRRASQQHSPWPSHVTCCCQVHPGPDGMPEEHPALLRFLAAAALPQAQPAAAAGAGSGSADASTSAEALPFTAGGESNSGGDGSGSSGGDGGGSSGGSGAAAARLSGGGGGFIFHCAHSCRHTDFDPLLRHTGSLGPGVPMNLIDLPMCPHLMVSPVTAATAVAAPASSAAAAVAAPSRPAGGAGGNGEGSGGSASVAAEPSSTSAAAGAAPDQAPSSRITAPASHPSHPAAPTAPAFASSATPGVSGAAAAAATAVAAAASQQTLPLVLSRVPELDVQYARLCSVQYIQHHTRFLRRRSGDSQESKALVYRPLMRGQGHPLAGLWRGTYGFHGMEILNFALEAPPGLHPADKSSPEVGEGGMSSPMLLRGVKITGDSNVPRGQVSIEMDVSAPHPRPTSPPGQRFALPSNLHTGVDEEGPDGLSSLIVQAVYRGRGHIAQTGFEHDSWTTVEVVVFNDACMGVAWHDLESFSMFSRLPL